MIGPLLRFWLAHNWGSIFRAMEELIWTLFLRQLIGDIVISLWALKRDTLLAVGEKWRNKARFEFFLIKAIS